MSRLTKVLGLLPFVLAMSCGSSSPPYTVGDFCTDIANSICQREAACGSNATPASCISVIVNQCCSTGQCNRVPPTHSDVLALMSEANYCAADVSTYDCTLLYEYYLPDSCLAAGGY
jgi:hypothetical protein